MNPEESRRIRCYREIAKVKNWKEALRTLYEWNKANKVQSITAGNQLAASYWEGKADGIEELIAKITNASRHNPENNAAEQEGQEDNGQHEEDLQRPEEGQGGLLRQLEQGKNKRRRRKKEKESV